MLPLVQGWLIPAHPTTPKVPAPCLSLPEPCENIPRGSSHAISSYTALVTHVQKPHNLVTICKGTSIILLAAEATYFGIQANLKHSCILTVSRPFHAATVPAITYPAALSK